MKPKCKLILKDDYRKIMVSPYVSQPVNFNIITEDQYEFFNILWPEAFEKDCNKKEKNKK